MNFLEVTAIGITRCKHGPAIGGNDLRKGKRPALEIGLAHRVLREGGLARRFLHTKVVLYQIILILPL